MLHAAPPLSVIRDTKVLLDMPNGLLKRLYATGELPPMEDLHRALARLIDARRTELREKAMVLGHPLYEETPADFEARFARYGRDWRRDRQGLAAPAAGRAAGGSPGRPERPRPAGKRAPRPG